MEGKNVEFRLLGPIELYDDVRRCRVELNGPKQRVLLATLLVRSGFVVTVEQLIEELWGSCPPSKAVNAVQAHVGRLRRLLQQHEHDHTGPERLVTSRTHGYILLVEPGETDVDQFKQATTAAKEIMAEDPAVAAGLLRTALKLWRGGALEGDDLGAICATEANLLDEQRLNTLESLYDACLLANQHA
jgi:SARP family transcriptional regulator, regulator of embCAB operon